LQNWFIESLSFPLCAPGGAMRSARFRTLLHGLCPASPLEKTTCSTCARFGLTVILNIVFIHICQGCSMLESTSSARIVMTTVASREEAARLGRTLVEERLAACATLLPAVHSIYHWRDQIETSAECLLLLKTEVGNLQALEARLHELHSYQTPEFLVLAVEAGSHAYLEWLGSNLRPPENRGA
jgi:periplasmic divalent cation tolerance protein